MLGRPGAQAPDHDVAGDPALVGQHRAHPAALDVVAGHLDPGQDPDALLGALPGEAGHGLARPGVAAHPLVEREPDARGVEVGPEAPDEPARVLAGVEIRGVAGRVLALPDPLVGGEVLLLVHADVAHLLEPERDRIVGPDVHAVTEDRVKRLGHVEVPHAAAGDTRRARAHAGLVEHDDILPRAAAAPPELESEMPAGAEPVDAGADDDRVDAARELAHADLRGRGSPEGAAFLYHSSPGPVKAGARTARHGPPA